MPAIFKTGEYLAAGVDHSFPRTLGSHIEEILLQSPVVQQHRIRPHSHEKQDGTRAFHRLRWLSGLVTDSATS